MTATTEYETVSEIDRDRFGRPMVIPEDGGTKVPYTRATTYAGTLEDTFNLGQWQQRKVAEGMAMRRDLIMQAIGIGQEPRKDSADHNKWKRAMDEVAGAAREAAAASSAATIGTAMHSLTERLDRGQPVGHVPDEYLPHLKAYEKATAEFEAVHIEQFCVLDDLKIGGTPDRILRIPGEEGLFIGDLKTGSIDYGLGKIGIQLAIYAHCRAYNIADGRRATVPGLRTDKALVIHLDALSGVCRLVWVALELPWNAVTLAGQVREWRRLSSKIGTPYGEEIKTRPMPDPGPPADKVNPGASAVDNALDNAIAAAATPDELVTLWQAAGDAWSDRHTQAAARRKAELVGATA